MQKKEFHIVGIGASAGGLEALEQFFKNLPPDSHMAFIVIQHLDPLRPSSMPDIMSRLTKMAVHVAAEGLKVEPDSVYLIPPNKNLGIKNGALYLEEQAEIRGLRLPVDFFLRSLAQENGPRAIAVILSGTGSDGTLGLKAIKSELGTVFAQEPRTAGYDGMPLNAINSGLVDFILPPQKMPAKIIEFAQHASSNGALTEANAHDAQQSLQRLFDVMSARTNHDFSGYKRSTILRRLQRRMSVKNIDTISEYTRYLKEDAAEVKALLKDLLISVTSFFRDPEAFAALKEKLCQTLKEKPSTAELRVWVAGCATGEEAYSIAMIIAECLSQLDKRLRVQMYATDIDTFALATARSGIYPESIASDVSAERLKNFFVRHENSWQVNKEIRGMVVFAPQDFIKDPPFSRMDLICCRNLLIYLENDIQKKLLPLLHYALKAGGLLLLGPSESLGEATDLFTPIDKKWRLFERREVAVAQERLRFPAAFSPVLRKTEEMTFAQNSRLPALSEKLFLDSYAPSFAVIDAKNRLLYVRGRTGKYLEIASGQPSLSIVEMAREGLRSELAAAIFEAHSTQKTVVREGVKVQYSGVIQVINLTVAPLTGNGMPPDLMMIVFQDSALLNSVPAARKGGRPGLTARLEEELKLTKDNMQHSIEELEAANEELKSANEELQSNAEELQSTNEELDTSREELQSLNEEMLTVNSELASSNEMLVKANDDLKNYLNRTDIAIIILDGDLKIRSYTPATTEVFNIRPIDISRPLAEITSRLEYGGVAADAQAVLHDQTPRIIEVQRQDGHWYMMRILPYLTVQNMPSGLVISFLDIDQQKQALKDLAESNRQLQASLKEEIKSQAEKEGLLAESNERLNELQTLLDNAPLAVWISHDPQCLAMTGNIFANQLFGVASGGNISKSAEPADRAVNYKTFSGGRELKPEELPAQRAAASGQSVLPSEIELVFEDGRRLDMLIGAVPLKDGGGNIRGAVAIGTDISERKKAESELLRLNRELQAISLSDQAIVHSSDEQTLLDQICRNMCDVVGYRMAWIGAVEHDEAKSIRPVAACGDSQGYLKEARITWADNERGRGPTGVAARSGKTDFLQDFAADAKAQPWRSQAMARGFRSSIALPLFDESGKVFYVLSLYSSETSGFAPSEVSLLEQMAADVGFGIRSLRSNQQRIEAEKALKESEARFKQMFEGHQAVMLLIEPESGRIEDANPAAAQFYGYSRETLKSMKISEINTLSQTEIRLQMQNALKPGAPRPELSHRLANGEIRSMEVHSSPIRVNNRTLMFSILHDITERNRIEKALKESEERLRSVLDNSRDVITRVNLQTGAFIYVSPAVESLTGYSLNEFKNRGWQASLDMIHPDDVAKVRSVLAILEDKGKGEAEYRWRTKSGGYVWVSNHLSVTKDEHGQPLYGDSSIRDVTERRKAGEALKESEQSYRSLFENMIDGYAFCEMLYENGRPTDFVYVSVNKAFENLTGLKDVTGRKVSRVIPGIRETNPELIEIYGRVADSGQPERFETLVEPLQRWYSVSVYSSKKGTFSAVFENISERKLAEEALRTSEEKYRGLFTNMTEGFALCEIITDADGRPVDYRILEVNQAWEEQTGLLGPDVRGKSVKELIPNLEQHWIDNYGEVALSGDPLHFENYNQFTDRWYEIYAYSPNKGQFVTMVQNITERKKAEEGLKEREQRFRTLIENLRSGVALIDEKGHFVTFNTSFLEMFGLAKDSTILNVNNQDWAAWQVYAEDGVTLLPVDEHPVRQATLTRKPVRDKVVGVRLPTGGKLTWMSINAEPTLKPDGTLQYLIATYYDITERKEAEEAIQRYSRELENHRNHLEELVKQRTEELQTLSHRLIMVQEEERRSLSRELHDQTGGSLTVLNLQLAKALRTPETMKSEVQEALKSVKELVTQVRTLSSTLHPGMLEDLGLIPTLAWYINDFSKKTGIEVRFEHSGMEITLAADMNINIYRMVQEALTNIARHSEVKEAKVSISLDNQVVKLTVEDKGAGFDIGAQSRGVGLRGMRERALALKGDINIVSAPGQGTCIEVTLPAVKAA